MTSEDSDLKVDDSAPERGTDRSSDRGGERELSNGKRDRSRDMLREELTRNVDDAARRSGRPRDWEPQDRPAREAREAATPKAKDGDQPTDAGAPGAYGSAGAAVIDTSAPPTAWKTAAKNAWHRTPPEVQEAVTKREIDHDRGVEPLKQKVAQHAEEDAAWAPYEPALRQASVSRSQAIANFFSWENYLRRDPLAAFPALVKSVGAEPAFQQLLQRQQAGGQQQPQAQPDPFQQYAASVEQRLNGFQQTIQQQEEARQVAHANAVIDEFKKSRPHFEVVRSQMASLVQSGVIPLKNGAVDLAAAYDASVKLHPDLFEQTVAERIAAEKKRQRDYADRARRAGASLGGAAPGSNNALGGTKKRPGARSVRDSINAAIDEMSDR
jgi:hypothetical protein